MEGNKRGEWGLVLGSQVQASMIDITRTSFIPLYKVIGPFLFFMSLLMMVWEELWLIDTIFLRVAIITRYLGCSVWVFATF
jgi:hypothetical protein